MTTKTSRARFLAQILVLAGVVLLVQAAVDVAGHSGQVRAADTVKPQATEYFMLPVYWDLGQKDVQDQVGLKAEQIRKLKDISRKYFEAVRQQTAKLDWAKMSPDERRQKSEQLAAENQKRLAGVRKQVEAVLTPKQMDKLDTVELRLHAPQLLLYGLAGDKLGLSNQQKEQLRQRREELQKQMIEVQHQMQKLQEQAGQAALDLLTKEQTKKLKRIYREGYTGWGVMGGQALSGVASPKK